MLAANAAGLRNEGLRAAGLRMLAPATPGLSTLRPSTLGLRMAVPSAHGLSTEAVSADGLRIEPLRMPETVFVMVTGCRSQDLQQFGQLVMVALFSIFIL